MADNELLQMLATEAERRAPEMLEGIERLAAATEPASDEVERLRIDAHGLRGAAMVVGQQRLAELSEQLEIALVQRTAPGTIDAELASKLTAGVSGLREGARAAAAGEPEPASVGEGLAVLSGND